MQDASQALGPVGALGSVPCIKPNTATAFHLQQQQGLSCSTPHFPVSLLPVQAKPCCILQVKMQCSSSPTCPSPPHAAFKPPCLQPDLLCLLQARAEPVSSSQLPPWGTGLSLEEPAGVAAASQHECN